MLTILIADDHSIVRYGLALLTERALGGSCIVTFAQSGQEVLDRLGESQYDILISDLMMPDQKGIGLIGAALDIQPALRIIIISVGPERDFAAPCLDSGACVYLNKSIPDPAFEAVIRSVAYDHEKYAPRRRQAAAPAASSKTGNSNDTRSFATLSQREREVILLMLRGQSLKQIAGALSLSPSTAGTLKARAFTKLGVHSLIELNRLAYYLGLDPDGALLP